MTKPSKPIYRPRLGPSPTTNRFYQSCIHSELFETRDGRSVALPVTPFPVIQGMREFIIRIFAFAESDGSIGTRVLDPDPSYTRNGVHANQVVEFKITQNNNKNLLPYFKSWLDYLGIRSSLVRHSDHAQALVISGALQLKALLEMARAVCGDIPFRGYKYRSALIAELLITDQPEGSFDERARVDAMFSNNKPDRHTPDVISSNRTYTRDLVEIDYDLGPTWGTCKQLVDIDRRYAAHRRKLDAELLVDGLWVTSGIDADGSVHPHSTYPLKRGGIRHYMRASFIAEIFGISNIADVVRGIGWTKGTMEIKKKHAKFATGDRCDLERLVEHYRTYPPLVSTKRAQLSCLIAGLKLSPTAPLQDHIDYVTWSYDLSAIGKEDPRKKPLSDRVADLHRHFRDYPWAEDEVRLVGDPVHVWRY